MKTESMGSKPEVEEKIADMGDIGLLGSQHARKLARSLLMTDKQFEELQKLERDARALLKSKHVETSGVVAKPPTGTGR